MTSDQIDKIQNKLQYIFNDKRLLETAFTHSSYAKQLSIKDNERMEYFGDAILDMVVSEYLCKKFPNVAVGVLSSMRAKVVSACGLRPVVDGLDILCFLQVSNGASDIGNVSKKIEANLYEAIIAAIYIDGGFEPARQFVLRTLADSLYKIDCSASKDDKTLLNEYCQSPKHKMTVTYVQSGRSGTDNNPIYRCDLLVDNVYMCNGEGASKKSSEQDAAKKLVTKWRIS